jgi:hypothetical protein
MFFNCQDMCQHFATLFDFFYFQSNKTAEYLLFFRQYYILRKLILERTLSMDNNKWSIGEGGELPIGFGLNLSANERAMAKFSNMSDTEKQKIVNESRMVHSKEEMEEFVNRLSD